MSNLLKLIRYLVFFIFIISNAIVASVAVWNLSIVEGNDRFSATATAGAVYLLVVAAMGLLLIFPILFLEIIKKRVCLGMVWFELAWVGLFGLLTLIGASLISSLSSRELCVPTLTEKSQFVTSALLVSPCSSAQVLGVFTWMPAAFLLTYATLLSILAFVRSAEDPAVWKCLVRDLPMDKILGEVKRNSILLMPQIRKTPVIYAPRPRYIIPPLLDCRSARNSAYDYQHPTVPPKSAPVRQTKTDSYLPSVDQGPYTSFYNAAVQKAIKSGDGSRAPPPPPPVQLSKGRSPPPLGDWPRLDATSRPRKKRYTHVVVPQAQVPPARQPSTAPRPSSRRAGPSSAPPPVERPAVTTRTSSTRTRAPGGSGRLGSTDSGSGSSGQHRPPPLDLSKISTHRSRSQHPTGARAGR